MWVRSGLTRSMVEVCLWMFALCSALSRTEPWKGPSLSVSSTHCVVGDNHYALSVRRWSDPHPHESILPTTPLPSLPSQCVADRDSGVTPDRSARIRGKFTPRYRVDSLCMPRPCNATAWSDEGPCAFDYHFSVQVGGRVGEWVGGIPCIMAHLADVKICLVPLEHLACGARRYRSSEMRIIRALSLALCT